MKYIDIVQFKVDKGLYERLGYRKLLTVGEDLDIVTRHGREKLPFIIKSKDPNTIFASIRNPYAIGVIFDEAALSKKVIEKVCELKKTIFVPLNEITTSKASDRNTMIYKARKIILAAHRARARICVVSLAASNHQLLSSAQMQEVAKLISGEKGPELLCDRI